MRILRPREMVELMEWLQDNRPELAAEIGPMSFLDGAQVLMRETEVRVRGSDSVAQGCAAFLEDLKKHHKRHENR